MRSRRSLDALAFLAAADDVEVRLGEGCEKLEVLAEAEVVDRGALGERDPIELDHAADPRTVRDVPGVAGNPVGDVQHGVCRLREAAPFLEPEGWPDIALVAERCAGGAEEAGHDQQVSRLGSCTARDALGPAERSHGEDEDVGPGRVAAHDRDAGLRDPLVQLEQVVHACVRRRTERDYEARGLGARGGQVAQVDGRSAISEVTKGDPVAAKVHALHERVLGDDHAVDLRGIVLDCAGKAAALQLGEEAELAEVREPH